MLQDFSMNYSFYGISAMEKSVSRSVLRGKSFGGAGILLSNKLNINDNPNVAVKDLQQL